MLCVRAPPSDQALNVRPDWIAGASTACAEPTIAVRVNGVAAVAPSRATLSPAGDVANVSPAVLGWSRRVVVPTSSPSVAVSRRRMLDGYSWSGAVTVPPLPVTVSIGCSWQAGQAPCSSTIVHCRLCAGSGVPALSTALPENESDWFADQVAVAAGVAIVATGTPAEMVCVAVEEAPALLVTRSVTRWRPAVVNVWLTCRPAPSNVPSPSKSQAYVVARPAGSLEPDASNATVSGTAPDRVSP